MKFLISGRTSSDPLTQTNNFNYISTSGAIGWTTIVGDRATPVPSAMNLLEMVVRLRTAPGVGNSRTLAVYKNGTVTSLSVTISGTATQATITGQSLAFAASDTIVFGQVGVTGSPASPGTVFWSILSESVATDYFNVFGGQVAYATASQWAPLQSGTNAWATAKANAYQVLPLSGTLTAFTSRIDAAPGASGAWDTSVLKNGVTSAAAVHYGATESGVKSWSGSVAVVAGDTVAFETLATGTPASAYFQWSATIVPNTPGESVVMYGAGTAPSTSAENYDSLFGAGSGVWSDVSIEYALYATLYTAQITGVYAIVGTAPGAGKSWTFTLNEEGAGTAAAVTIADTATTGNASFSVNTTAGNRYTLKSTPSGTPAAMTGGARVGFKVFIAPDAPPTPQRYNVYVNHAVTRAGSY